VYSLGVFVSNLESCVILAIVQAAYDRVFAFMSGGDLLWVMWKLGLFFEAGRCGVFVRL
jgi:hypothetical protein